MDAILYISDLPAKRNGPFDLDGAWQQVQTQYHPHTDGRSLYDIEDEEYGSASESKQASTAPSGARIRSARRLRRLAVLATLLLSSIVAQAAGLNIFGAIAQWTDEAFRFVPASSDNTPGSDGSQAGQEEPGQ